MSMSPSVGLLLATVLVAGCATPPAKEAPTATPVAPAVTRLETVPVTESTRPRYAGPWEDPANPLSQRTLYFDYDAVEIKPEYLTLLRLHAGYLGSHPGQRVTLEGHTDERGTREYNQALGDQRADAVRRVMLAEGVPPKQLETLSYGEERPADSGHGESSWRLNRRVIIQY